MIENFIKKEIRAFQIFSPVAKKGTFILGHNPEEVKGKSFLPVLKNQAPDEHRLVVFSEVGLPQSTPDPMDFDAFKTYRKKRIKEDGTTWFLDYTVNGRSAMVKTNGWKYCFYENDMEESVNKVESLFQNVRDQSLPRTFTGARKNFKPQYTSVYEDLKFLQQRRYRTLWTDYN
jgi:hypothetical protein